MCREALSKDAAEDVFILTYDRMRRYEGAWHVEERNLVPSCVFLVSRDGRLLAEELWKCGILGERDGVCEVCREAEEFLRGLYGEGRHLEMSKGIIRDGRPEVTAGPLKGMEKRIRRIDRHKKLVRLEVPVERDCGEMSEKSDSVKSGSGEFGSMKSGSGTGRWERGFEYIVAGLEIVERV